MALLLLIESIGMITGDCLSPPILPSKTVNGDASAESVNQGADFAALMFAALIPPQDGTSPVPSNDSQTAEGKSPTATDEAGTPLLTPDVESDGTSADAAPIDQARDVSTQEVELAPFLLIVAQIQAGELAPNGEATAEALGPVIVPQSGGGIAPEAQALLGGDTTESVGEKSPAAVADLQNLDDGTSPSKDHTISQEQTAVVTVPDEPVNGAPSKESDQSTSNPSNESAARGERAQASAHMPPPAVDGKRVTNRQPAQDADSQSAKLPTPAGEGGRQDFAATGNAVARGNDPQPGGNLGQVISALAKDRNHETSPALKLGQEDRIEEEPSHETVNQPARVAHENSVAALGNERQKSADNRDGAWPGNSQDKKPNLEQQSGATIVTPDPTARSEQAQNRDTAEPSAWRTVERLAGDIVSRLRIGAREAIIQLEPQGFGSIKIDLRMDGDKLHARIVADAHEARALLENHLPELRQALQASGVDLADVRVFHGGGSGASGNFSQSFQQTPHGRQEQGLPFGNRADAAPDAAHSPTAPVARDNGRVSIRA